MMKDRNTKKENEENAVASKFKFAVGSNGKSDAPPQKACSDLSDSAVVFRPHLLSFTYWNLAY